MPKHSTEPTPSGNPFLLPPQSVVSFSGGRTSGLMAKRIADAHDAAGVPRPCYVFCNTGKEREETLAFVHECDRRWSLNLRWLEYRFVPGDRARRGPAAPGHHVCVEATYETASRDGEPFKQMALARRMLPNPVARCCTAELKIRTTNRFVRRGLGWGTYHNAIGLRADEPDRVFKLMRKARAWAERTLFGDVQHEERSAALPAGETPLCPLYEAGVYNQDVLDFWAAQSFDLGLPVDPKTGKTRGGNCDLCFLKGAGALIELMRQWPEASGWWQDMESLIPADGGSGTATFRNDRPRYYQLQLVADGRQEGPGWLFSEDWHAPGCDEMRCTD